MNISAMMSRDFMKYKDKLKHFTVSFLLFIVLYLIISNLILAFAICLLLGFIKELYDQFKRKNTFKEFVIDFSANIIGIVLGILLIKFLIPNI